jgi:hypothetical protein
MTQIEHLNSECKTPNSNLSTAKEGKRLEENRVKGNG